MHKHGGVGVKKMIHHMGLLLVIACVVFLSVNDGMTEIVVDEDGKPLAPGTYILTGIVDDMDWDGRRCMISETYYPFSKDVKLYLPGNAQASAADFSQGTEVKFYRYQGEITSMWKLAATGESFTKNMDNSSDQGESSKEREDDVKLEQGVWHN